MTPPLPQFFGGSSARQCGVCWDDAEVIQHSVNITGTPSKDNIPLNISVAIFAFWSTGNSTKTG